MLVRCPRTDSEQLACRHWECLRSAARGVARRHPGPLRALLQSACCVPLSGASGESRRQQSGLLAGHGRRCQPSLAEACRRGGAKQNIAAPAWHGGAGQRVGHQRRRVCCPIG